MVHLLYNQKNSNNMIDLETIFDNIEEYSNNIDDLVNALKQVGIKNFEEFKNATRENKIPVDKPIQDKIKTKLDSSEEDDWQQILGINTAEAYQCYLDSYPEGKYRNSARNKIEELQRVDKSKDSDEVWNNINKNSIDELQNFVKDYPNSTHLTEANKILKNLRIDQYLGVDIKALAKQIKAIRTDYSINNPDNAIYEKIVDYINTNKISVNDLLTAIREDKNFISGKVAYLLWENNIITDFSSTGIDSDFITHMMYNTPLQRFQAPEPLLKITNSPCTEVYFWGIPSSGKSCALGAIMSAANSGKVAKSMQRDPDCQGYGYMNRLANLFKANGVVGTLPEGTSKSSTYEMGFTLEDEKGWVHPITCIDLAGELVRCMYKNDAGELYEDEDKRTLETLTNILIDNRTKNRKIHFFVIEYGAEDREYEGLPQSTYLEAAVAYINRTGIFKKDTDGLYLLITKVDKAKAIGKDLQDKLKDYINTNYKGFYNGLEKICKDNEIYSGKVVIQPFTLGDVCFQYYCKFKEDTAAQVVQTLLDRSYKYKPGKLNKLRNKLNK